MTTLLQTILNQSTLESTEQLAETFTQAEPFSHLVIEDFFAADFCQALLNEFPAFEKERARNENGTIGGKAVQPKVRNLGEHYRALDQLVSSPDFLQWLSRATDIPDLIYDPDYFGGGTHENRHGQDLDPHVDFNRHPVTNYHRRLNLIVYLNHEWSKDWGGAIEFHQNPRLDPTDNRITQVLPLFNRCVIFATHDHSWHGFERINLPEADADPRSRKSVALYFYSKTRPSHEYKGRHSTIYVDRPLPAHIQPGTTLNEEDYQRIRILLARRDQHLERLYRENHRLQDMLDNLTSSRTFWLLRRCLTVAYKIRQRLLRRPD